MSGPLAQALAAVKSTLEGALSEGVAVRDATQTVRAPCVMVAHGYPAATLRDAETFQAAPAPAWDVEIALTAIPRPAPGQPELGVTRAIELADQIITALPGWTPRVESVQAVATADGVDYPAALIHLTVPVS